MSFTHLLKSEIIESGSNYYVDNYDYYAHPSKIPLKKQLINLGKRLFYRKFIFSSLFKSEVIYRNIFLGKIYRFSKYLDKLEIFYNKLEDSKSKELLVKIIAFRILGYSKVKLPFHNKTFWRDLKQLELSRIDEDAIVLNFKPWKLYLYDLSQFGRNIKLFFSSKGCYSTFLRDHYRYQISHNTFIGAAKDDVVLDLGGCYGDTALYFAEYIGDSGKVYSFEFIPGSIEIFKRNLRLNPVLSSRISIIENPLWDKSGLEVYYKDHGGGSQVSFDEFPGWEGTKRTTTIDEFVVENNIDRIDYIKTDIEGAEPFALNGAINVLRKFKPKLAISIYHSMDDFVNIVQQIDALELGYKFYLGHASIYASETVLFCSPKQHSGD